MLQVKGEHLDFEVEGYIGKPELTRSNRMHEVECCVSILVLHATLEG